MNGLSTVAAVREFTILLSVILGGFLCWSAYHKLVRPRAARAAPHNVPTRETAQEL